MSSISFTEKQQVFLTGSQSAFLNDEVARRKKAGIISDVPEACGENGNLNRGTLIREALEVHFAISSSRKVEPQ